ncbi:MAG: RNA methyltransferase [Butyrivibrio sp.]|jgi:TrmH family RNA methyltransferase|nr:RNA methyltransferase [Butyrivibrio sp.]
MIASTSNAKVRKIVSYVEKNKARREDGVFIVEGIRMNVEIPPQQILETYVSEGFLQKAGAQEKNFLEGLRTGYETVTDEVFRKMSDTQSPQGILSVVRQMRYTLEDLFKTGKCGNCPMLLLLEDVQDPGNLGTMFRSAEGAGVSGIVLSRGSADVYNPKVVRSTMGAIFRMPFLYVDSMPAAMKELRSRGICSYAAHLKGTKSYDEMNYTDPCAFLIGNEGNGLTKETADAADTYILIPMLGRVESMNAATSAAILTFEAARQRRLEH